MDYKQKYEQLAKFIKDLYPFMSDYCKEKTEGMIPELKESEDERIRKSILEEFKVKAIGGHEEKFFRNGVKIKDALAWLEKQGERREYNPYKVTVESIISMVEKYDYPDSDLQDFYNNIKIKCKDVIEYDKTLIKKPYEQEPANNIEPKFKPGDIIINEYGFIMQIDGIDGNMYVYHVLDGTCIFKHDITKTEESCHLWTIQDAKDGDVLYHKNPLTGIEYIVMSSGVNRFGNIDSYFRYNSVDGFGISVPSVFNTKEDITPATKEQRDLLFQEMKEAGYEWDAEKKELKKIEYKHTEWSEEDEEWMKSTFDKLSIGGDMCLGEKCWIQSIKERMKGE